MEPKRNKKVTNPANDVNLAADLLEKTGQPTAPQEIETKKQTGAAPGGTASHHTYIISDELDAKIKFIAQREGFSIREVVEKAFQNTISSYEKKKGAIKLRPKKKGNIDDIL